MVCKCVVCGKETIKAGAVNLVTHGVCPTGICEKAWNDWIDMPSPKPTLEQYHAILSGKSKGGKYP